MKKIILVLAALVALSSVASCDVVKYDRPTIKENPISKPNHPVVDSIVKSGFGS